MEPMFCFATYVGMQMLDPLFTNNYKSKHYVNDKYICVSHIERLHRLCFDIEHFCPCEVILRFLYICMGLCTNNYRTKHYVNGKYIYIYPET